MSLSSAPARKSNHEKNEFNVEKVVVNKAFDSHWHDYFEIKLILSGRGNVTINENKYEFEKGCLYFVIPENIHMFSPDNKVLLYNVNIRESLLFDESIIQKLSCMNRLFFKLNDDEYKRILYIMELLEFENKNSGEYKEQLTKNLLECLLLFLIRKSPDKKLSSENYSTSVQIAISYIKMHFRQNISVEQVASVLGFSAGYFSTLFHKSTGVTFVRYLNNLRLEYATKLLNHDKFSIQEVAKISGFSSYSNFLKAFKAKYGVLPKDYKGDK